MENFTDSLWIDGRYVTVQLLYSGKAGLEYIYDDGARSKESGGFLFFGDRTVWDGSEDVDEISVDVFFLYARIDERSPYRRDGFIDFLLGFQDILIPGVHAQRDHSSIRADTDFTGAVNRDLGIGKSRCGCQDQNDGQKNSNQFLHENDRPFCGEAYV